MILALCASLALLGDGQTIKTDFLPSRDLPNFQNPSDYVNKGHVSGMCNGIDELALSYLQVRRRNPPAFSLNEITDTIRKYHGEEYLRKTLGIATEMAYSKGLLQTKLSSNPNQFVNDIVTRMQSSHDPQSVALVRDGEVHRVTVYGATQTANGWELKISDSNFPDRAVADHVTLTADPKTGSLTLQAPGKEPYAYKQGGVVPTQAMPADAYIEMMNKAIAGEPIQKIRESVSPVETTPLPKEALNVQDDKVGGVLIRFDPKLFSETADEGKLQELTKRLTTFIQSGHGGAEILSLEPSRRRLNLVPFSALSPSGNLGLTRIEGFVVKPDGTTFLAGEKEQGKPSIPSEWLVVALQSQYAQALTPYISLDPDPNTYSGPQLVRIGQIPNALRSSSFVKTMLDADYLMKKIGMGRVKPAVEGFKCWEQRMEESGSSGAVRMWFTPISLPAADSFIYRDKGSIAVCFQSEVAVKSEREKNASETGFINGAADPVAEQSAQAFSLALDQMSSEFPEFHALRGVFDASKLAVCWRTLKVKPAGIEAWLNASPAKVEIPKSYIGLGPDTTPSGYATSGGAIADVKFRESAAVETDRLRPMIESSGSSEVEIEFPATLPVADAERAGFEADNLLAAGKSALNAGDVEGALALLNQVLLLDPQDEEALTVKAMDLTLAGRYQEALEIMNGVISRAPSVQAFRAVVRARAGDPAGSLQDASQAEAAFPESESVFAATTAARLLALDAEGASHSLRVLRSLSPANPLLSALGAQIDILKFLGPEKTRERQRLQEQIPPPIALAIQQAPSVSTPAGFAANKGILEQIKSGAAKVPEGLYVKERLRLALSTGTLMGRLDKDSLAYISKEVQQLVADHPDWPSAQFALLCVQAGTNAPPEVTSGSLQKLADLEPKSDPVLTEMYVLMGTHKLAAYMAVMMQVDGTFDPKLRRLSAAIAAKLAVGGPGEAFLRQVVDHPDIDGGFFAAAEALKGQMAVPAERIALVDKMTENVEEIPPSDPAFMLALFFCFESVGVFPKDSPAYARLLSRGMALVKAGAPPKAALPIATKFGSGIVLMEVGACSRLLTSPSAADRKALDALGTKMDRLEKPESSTDSLESVTKTIDVFVSAYSSYFQRCRSSVAEGVAQVRAADGPFLADLVEFTLARLNKTKPGKVEDEHTKAMNRRHPGLSRTPSYARLLNLEKEMSGGILKLAPEKVAWQKVLVGIKTRYQGLIVQEVLKFLDSGGSDGKGYLAQCAAKTELGTEP